jgi:acyl-CoA thioester hydrolase
MLDRTDLEPLFFAPFVSSVMRVEPAWIDYNGHLNMAYYNVLFDRCVDEAYELLGIGLSYLNTKSTRPSRRKLMCAICARSTTAIRSG